MRSERRGARGAILSSWDIRLKLLQLDRIGGAVCRCRELNSDSPREERTVVAALAGLAFSVILAMCLCVEVDAMVLTFAGMSCLNAAVSAAIWRMSPKGWGEALDGWLGEYRDPVNLDAYQALQEARSGGSLSLGAVEAWLRSEERTLRGEPDLPEITRWLRGADEAVAQGAAALVAGHAARAASQGVKLSDARMPGSWYEAVVEQCSPLGKLYLQQEFERQGYVTVAQAARWVELETPRPIAAGAAQVGTMSPSAAPPTFFRSADRVA